MGVLIFWACLAASIPALLTGFLKRSPLAFSVSGILLLLPCLYFAGAENWVRFLSIIPAIPFGLAFWAWKAQEGLN
ncbi:hypothetical protein A8F94_15785 [Bacillus sp. FJAT-27225]|uniref:hypothetical protein n=1 Tax=Bacillus sp. FJAT-27225 TaxID=1743144 RepID=UPI00080C22FB|nr:hypothetical protein [Bacillus sp. FJAT-27225]OCA84180.1 hypothetical protein A8F94_15785 [Bacillus sp. FJAT-27225]